MEIKRMANLVRCNDDHARIESRLHFKIMHEEVYLGLAIIFYLMCQHLILFNQK